MLRACEALLFTRPYLCSASVCNLCGYLALWVAGILVCYIYRQQGTKVFPAGGFQNPPQTPSRDWKDNGFGLPINEKKKDSETGEYVDAPVFVDCALFGARAEALAPYLTKGKKVSVDGRLRYHSWMKNDEKRHALSVLVTDIEFADSKGAGKDTVSAQGQSTEPETYDADIPF